MPKILKSVLAEGNPLDPQPTDVIVAFSTLNVGQPVPCGWRVLTGNSDQSQIAFVGYRYELEIN